MKSPVDSVYPYTPKAVDTVNASVEVLNHEPQERLLDNELVQARVFAGQLFAGHVEGFDQGVPSMDLEALHNIKADPNKLEFFTDYFKTEEAAAELAKIGPDSTSDAIVGVLQDTGLNGEDVPAAHKALAAKSRKWFIGELANAIETGSDDVIENQLTVVYKPEVLLAKLDGLRSYRSYYRSIYTALTAEDYTPENARIHKAQLTLLRIHMSKVNAMAAVVYPNALVLARQLDKPASDQAEMERNTELKAQLSKALPFVSRAFDRNQEERIRNSKNFENSKDRQLELYPHEREDFLTSWGRNVLRRLDYIRNGATIDSEGRVSSVGRKALGKAIELELPAIDETKPKPRLPQEMISYMESTRWNATQWADFNAAVLKHWRLLSEYEAPSWDDLKERTGPAPDGRWQVVIRTDGQESLEVIGEKKVVAIPEDFDRALIQDGGGALPVSAHELEHVLQDEYKESMFEGIPLAKLGGKGKVVVRELGGIANERRFLALAGKERKTNTTYLRALVAKIGGASLTQIGIAFKQAGENTSARVAADRILRLFRHGGENTQPMDYLEQDMMAESFLKVGDKDRLQTIALASNFSFDDLADLYSLGLVHMPEDFEHDPVNDVLEVFTKNYYATAR